MKIQVLALLLALSCSCGSRHSTVRESASVDFRRETISVDSLASYLSLTSSSEIDTVEITVRLDSLQRPRHVSVKARGVRRRDSLTQHTRRTIDSQISDSIISRKNSGSDNRKSTSLSLWPLYTAIILLLITSLMFKKS